VLGSPDCFLITAGDMRLLPKILDAACRFTQRPADEIMSALVREYQIGAVFSY